jgi:hypothetical protein
MTGNTELKFDHPADCKLHASCLISPLKFVHQTNVWNMLNSCINKRATWRRDDIVGVATELPAGKSRTLIPVGSRSNLFFETS